MNIVFFGSGEFGIPTLARLAAPDSPHHIRAVVTQPDRPAGRGGKLTPTPIALWAAANLPDTPILKPEKVSDPAIICHLRQFAGVDYTPALSAAPPILQPPPHHPACFVVIAFGQKMPRALLDGVFAINLHASLLPRWRGAAPINAAILAGDTATGNSVITLADRMDAGLTLAQSQRPIDPMMTAGELHDLLAADGPDLVDDVLLSHTRGTLFPITQDESLVTKAAKLSKADGVLDFSRSAHECQRRVHGLTPWPGVTVLLADLSLKLLRVSVEPPTNAMLNAHHQGTLINVDSGLVACGSGTALRLLDVQPAGKRPMKWEAFARGRTIERGTMLKPPVGATE